MAGHAAHACHRNNKLQHHHFISTKQHNIIYKLPVCHLTKPELINAFIILHTYSYYFIHNFYPLPIFLFIPMPSPIILQILLHYRL